MIDSHSLDAFTNVIRRESRSFLMYLADSLPWPSAEGREVDRALRPIIQAERDGLAKLGKVLIQNRIPPPYIGSYPSSFTTANFVTLQHLIPPLGQEQRQAVGALETELRRVRAPEIREHLSKFLEIKRLHLHALERMASESATTVPSATSRDPSTR